MRTFSYIVMSDVAQKLEEILKEEFAKFDPATLQYLEHLQKTSQLLERLFRTCWMNLFPKKRRRVCKNLYFQNLSNQDPLPGKERGEKRKSF